MPNGRCECTDLAVMTTDCYPANRKDLAEEVGRIENMINSPQVRDMRNRNRETLGYVRPRNAATMILLAGEPGVDLV